AAPARRDRRRHDLPAPPLHVHGEASGVDAGRRDRAACEARRSDGHVNTLRARDVKQGDELPTLDVPITTTLVVVAALASRDFPRRPRNRDRESAVARVSASTISRKTAIAGIGQTEFSKDSGRTELRLAIEATQAALKDAGLEPKDVDGMVTFTLDRNDEIDI